MGEIMLLVALLIFAGTLCLIVVQVVYNMSDDNVSLRDTICHDEKK